MVNVSVRDFRPGDVLSGKYRIVSELGAGGFGRVFSAENLNLNTRVAIKVMQGVGPDRRLEREGRLAASLQSPHTVRIFDLDRLPCGTPFIVMELLEGQTLRDLLARRGRLPSNVALELTVQICSALQEAHAASLAHRDIKPSNLFVVGSDMLAPHIKLLDFGLARPLELGEASTVTESGTLVGSPAYMAPERLRSELPTVQSDLWSVGVVLFEMLSGELPFVGPSNSAMLAAIAADPPRLLSDLLPNVSPHANAIVMRCLRKRPDDRFESASELAAEIRKVLANTPGQSPSVETATVSVHAALSPAPRAKRSRLKHALVGGVALAGALLALSTFRRAPRASDLRAASTATLTDVIGPHATPSMTPGLPKSSPRPDPSARTHGFPSESAPQRTSDATRPPRAPQAPLRTNQVARAPAPSSLPSMGAPNAVEIRARTETATPGLFTEPDF